MLFVSLLFPNNATHVGWFDFIKICWKFGTKILLRPKLEACTWCSLIAFRANFTHFWPKSCHKHFKLISNLALQVLFCPILSSCSKFSQFSFSRAKYLICYKIGRCPCNVSNKNYFFAFLVFTFSFNSNDWILIIYHLILFHPGLICILDIDIQGVKSIKETDISCNYIFVQPPSMEILKQRLQGESDENIFIQLFKLYNTT